MPDSTTQAHAALPTFSSSKDTAEPLKSPPRATTIPHKHTSSKHHLPLHPHRAHQTHRRDKSVPQSAIQPSPSSNPFGIGDILSKVSSSASRVTGTESSHHHHHFPHGHHIRHGRDESVHGPTRSDDANLLSKAPGENTATLDSEQERVRKQAEQAQYQRRTHEQELARKQAQVVQLRSRREEGQESLRHTLAHLSKLSTTTTRRLDYTYYSLLTSLSNLSATVQSLRALVVSVQESEHAFAASRSELEGEVGNGVSSMESMLERQAKRAGVLQERLEFGVTKVADLDRRMEHVRQRIQGAEDGDSLHLKRTRGRWRMLWGMACTLAVVGSVLWIARLWHETGKLVGVEQDMNLGVEHMWDIEDAMPALNTTATSPNRETPVTPGSDFPSGKTATEEHAVESLTSPATGIPHERLDTEATLRLLDEL